MKRFASAIFLTLIACGQTKQGAEIEATASLRIAGTEAVSLAVGSMGGCTIIGTNLPATGPKLFLGLTSAHCFPQQLLLCQGKTITWGNRKSGPQ